MIRWFEQLFCKHEFIRLIDREAGRLYMECMRCLKRTPGIKFIRENDAMSGYSVNERKIGKQQKPVTPTCGDCGEPVERGRLLCDDCLTDIATEGSQKYQGAWRG